MKIKMKATMLGSETGNDVKTFSIGEIYNTTEELAKIFVEDLKVATYYQEPSKEPVKVEEPVIEETKEEEKKEEEIEVKMEEAPENKKIEDINEKIKKTKIKRNKKK